MDAVEFLRNLKKMCDDWEKCSVCPFKYNGCGSFAHIEYPEGMVSAVEEWVAKHPAKTRQSEFLKTFKPSGYCGGVINICPQIVQCDYRTSESCGEMSCFECKKGFWLAEVE